MAITTVAGVKREREREIIVITIISTIYRERNCTKIIL